MKMTAVLLARPNFNLTVRLGKDLDRKNEYGEVITCKMVAI